MFYASLGTVLNYHGNAARYLLIIYPAVSFAIALGAIETIWFVRKLSSRFGSLWPAVIILYLISLLYLRTPLTLGQQPIQTSVEKYQSLATLPQNSVILANDDDHPCPIVFYTGKDVVRSIYYSDEEFKNFLKALKEKNRDVYFVSGYEKQSHLEIAKEFFELKFINL